MCFSASASFGSGVLLAAIGIASIKKVKQPSQFAFASIPLIFAFQQFTEGFVWLSLSDPEFANFQTPTTYIFLFFAQIVWPSWVPYSILLLEKKENRKTTGKILVAIGFILSMYLLFCLLSFPVEAKILGQHISYVLDYPLAIKPIGGILYITATIVPHFLSPSKRVWALGAAILTSYFMTAIFYSDYIISVWCFFAAIISIIVYAIMQEMKKRSLTEKAN